jgi:MFS family permease
LYNFLRLTYFLPYFAFITCIIVTVFKDFEKSTHTHCKVINVLPSISAIIAGFEPQRFIWRFCFALTSIPRYLIGYLQFQRLLNRHHVALPEYYRLIQMINSSIHFLELTFLLLLTYISSKEIKRMHEYGFIGFMMCSLLHMFCTIIIDYYWPRTKNSCLTEKEKYFRRKRFKWFMYNSISFLISLYFFFRHNFFCEPYIYSIYCFFEYFVILTNIGYHSIVPDEWDQQEGQIQFFY